MKCPHCNKEHLDDTKYCPNTGKKIELLACHNEECPDYRKKILPPDSKSCPSCGKPLHFLDFTVGGVPFRIILVNGGTFTMGATSEQGSDVCSHEKPSHQVTLSTFYIGETQVTQALWRAVMGSNPSYFKGDDLPVECVSWGDCQEFITKLNFMTGKQFRLPTEAEWEYAARGGKESEGYKYSGSNNIDEVAWNVRNSEGVTHAVKTKRPNELGIYDMSGNVQEWCQDRYGKYSSSSMTNPKGSRSASHRVCRGGSWYSINGCCRLSYRDFDWPDSSRYRFRGLRLVVSEL